MIFLSDVAFGSDYIWRDGLAILFSGNIPPSFLKLRRGRTEIDIALRHSELHCGQRMPQLSPRYIFLLMEFISAEEKDKIFVTRMSLKIGLGLERS